MENPSAKDAITGFMKANGYTSLCNPSVSCGCHISDLIPCGVENVDLNECQCGYTKPCIGVSCLDTECENRDYIHSDCMTLTKPEDGAAKTEEAVEHPTTRKGQNYGYCGDVSGNPFGPADMP